MIIVDSNFLRDAHWILTWHSGDVRTLCNHARLLPPHSGVTFRDFIVETSVFCFHLALCDVVTPLLFLSFFLSKKKPFKNRIKFCFIFILQLFFGCLLDS